MWLHFGLFGSMKAAKLNIKLLEFDLPKSLMSKLSAQPLAIKTGRYNKNCNNCRSMFFFFCKYKPFSLLSRKAF